MNKIQEAYQVMQAEWVKLNDVQVGDKVRCIRFFGNNELGCFAESATETGKQGKDRCVQDEAVGVVYCVFKNRIAIEYGPPYSEYGLWSFPFFVLDIVDQPREKPETMVRIDGKDYSESTIKNALKEYVK